MPRLADATLAQSVERSDAARGGFVQQVRAATVEQPQVRGSLAIHLGRTLGQDDDVLGGAHAQAVEPLGVEASVDPGAVVRLGGIVVVAVFDDRDVVVDDRVATLEQRARHQNVLAEVRARERVAFPQFASNCGGDVLEVEQQPLLVRSQQRVGLGLGQARLDAPRDVARIVRAQHARHVMRVGARDVPAVRSADLLVVEVLR